MFVTKHHHDSEVSRLTEEAREKDAQIAELKKKLYLAERTRFELVEVFRGVLGAAGIYVQKNDPLRGDRLKTIGHDLPYLLNGTSAWSRVGPPFTPGHDVHGCAMTSKALVAQYGFSLPADPVMAVKSTLYIAMALFEPGHSVPLNIMRSYRSPNVAHVRHECTCTP